MPIRLKFLELQGYKTFANRTPFDLSAPITAIVGPNGSGKSNIADCIRWVLGEQSYSLLRGKKTEDMIFSGSESRPRLGMASATITFDNETGWLPIDFNEVAVTRRAHRDGDNEYLINGQRVRLRDVAELLYQSGLAERTYTVIGQGVVDAVLSLRADERRRLFEEAAGIGLYRTRKEDALRRLDVTRRNLERVHDILAELGPRLQSLERQAKRAKEFEQSSAELNTLLRQWYGFHWHRSQNELSLAKEAARLQEQKLEQVRRDQIALDEKTEAVREKTRTRREALNSLHIELSELHSQREAVSRNLAVSMERRHLLESQLSDSGADVLDLEVQVSQLKDQLISTEQEAADCLKELEEAESQFASGREALGIRKVAHQRKVEEIARSQERISELTSQQGQLKALVSGDNTRLERTRRSIAASQDQVASMTASLAGFERETSRSQKAAEIAEKAYLDAIQSLSSLRREMAVLDTQRSEALEEHTRLGSETARLRAELEILEQAEFSQAGYASGTRLLVEAARQGELTGFVGVVHDSLEMPAELEIPVAAALGDYIDAVLLDETADQALRMLVETRSRGALLPIASLKLDGYRKPAESASDDVLGIASQLVKCSSDVRPAVDLLLGDVLVVSSWEAARRLLPVQPPGMRVVTLSGEIFHATGQIETFGGNSQPGQTILSRPRQKKEKMTRLDNVTAKLDLVADSIREVESKADRLRLEERDFVLKSEQYQREWRELLSISKEKELDFARAAKEIELQKEQINRLEHEHGLIEEEKQTHEDQLEELQSVLVEFLPAVRTLQAELSELPLEDLETQATYWQTQVALARQRVATAQERQTDRQTALERLAQTQLTIRNRRDDLQKSLLSVETERTSLHQQEAEINQKITALQERIRPVEDELVNLEAEAVEFQGAETAARQKLSLAEQLNAQSRINMDRRQEALDSLRRRIEDDFGLVAFDYAEEVSGPTPLPLEGMVEDLPLVASLSPEIEEAIRKLRLQIRRLGPINPEALAEFEEVRERHKFLNEQVADLNRAEEDVRQVIKELDELMEREFHNTFHAVADEFKEIFTRLFGGGQARLVLTDPDDLSDTGIDIEARLPGRRSQGLALLSGGERSLTATAIIFALLQVSPTPFCVLDEVDAMLDEANIARFRELLRELSRKTQIIIITHNRNTVQVADVIYGVTMGRDSVSQVLSLKLDEISDLVE